MSDATPGDRSALHVEDGVLRRAGKLLDIVVGKTSMRTGAASPLKERTVTWTT